MRLAEKSGKMKKTNFDRYLEDQLKDPAFAARFERAVEAWDVALQIAALRQQGDKPYPALNELSGRTGQLNCIQDRSC